MANVLLTTHWSSGEVYPLIRIGRELKARGHDVSVITNCYFENAVQKAGLNFLALDTPEEFEQLITDGYLFNSPQGFLKIYQKYVLPKVVSEYELIAQLYRFQETVLVARDTPGIAARIAAQKLEMPLVAVMSSPSHLSTKSLVAEMIGSILGDEINQIRKEIGLSAVENWSAWLRDTPSKTIGLWADWFADATLEESSGVLQPGFIWDDEPLSIPIDVQEFLQQKPSPILITGGTTSLAGEKFFAVSAAACKLLGIPGLLVTRHEKLVPNNLPDGVKWVKYVPSLVNCMPYTNAIIHHGGLVTSGQALAVGIPQLVLGGGADQLYTGSCLNRLGVGESLSLPQWQPEIVAQSLHRLTNLDSVRDRCQILAGKFIATNPVANTCDVIEAQISQPTVSFNQTIALKRDINPVVVDRKNQKTQHSQLLALAEKLSPEKLALLELKLMKKDRKILKQQTIPPLPRQPELNYFPLSFAQQRLWFLDQLEPGNPTYNISGAVELTGLLNIAALEQSFNALVQRHEALRTTFAILQEQPMQVIAQNLEFKIPVIDLEDLPEKQQQQQIQTLITEEQARPFNLGQRPLLRVTLLRFNPKAHMMLFSMHHIISDGWSMGILIQEIAKLYEAFSTGKTPVLPELPIQYADFAVWQRQWLQTQALETQLAYWKNQLAGKLPVLKLPSDRPRPQVPTYRGAAYSFSIPANLSQGLQQLSHQAGVSLFMTLLAGFQILLHRYTKQEDIIVGTDVANRNRAEIEGLIGFFINLLVLRTDLSGNPTFYELLERVKEVALAAYAHQDLPFAKLVEEIQPERNLQPTPLFQVLFVLQNIPKSQQSLLGLSMKQIEVDIKTTKFDLGLFINETEQGLVGNWNYSTDLFDASTIARMTDNFQVLLHSIITQSDARIGSLEILTETEIKQQAMEQQERKAAKRQKFMSIAPKAVSLSVEQLIKTDYLQAGQQLPLVIQANSAEIDVISWAENNRAYLETELFKHGAILFRGFNVKSVSEFENFAQTICPNLFAEYGDLPRTGEGGKVYGSTPYPADKAILFHNESSHLHCFPLKIWFYCVQPAAVGGETPIVDCRKAYQLLSPQLREKLASKQLMYIRNFAEGLDVSWQNFFQTTDKNKVENYCCEAGMEFEWYDDNRLVTRQIRPALAVHPKNGEPVFFNQIQLHHISYLDKEVQESLLSIFGESKLPRNVYFGDATPISQEEIAEINTIYQRSQTSFPWHKGDIIMLDNMLAAHGRNPFIGQRKIVVAMAEMTNGKDIKTP